MAGKQLVSRNMSTSPFLVTFAAAAMWQTAPCDTEEEVDAVIRQAQGYGGERGIAVWDRRESIARVASTEEPELPLDPWPYASIGGSRHTKSWPHNKFDPRTGYEQDEARYVNPSGANA